jgi:hypothetical protein
MREDIEIQMPLRGEGVTEQVVRCLPTLFAGGEQKLAAIAVVPTEPETVRHWLELHDSVLNPYTLDRPEGDVRLDGYVHRWERRGGIRFGLGFVQQVAFRFSGLIGIPQVRATRSEVSDGSLVGPDQTFANMMPIPSELDGHVQLSLTLCDGSLVEIGSRGCQIAAIGEARFVEVLLPELDPEPA